MGANAAEPDLPVASLQVEKQPINWEAKVHRAKCRILVVEDFEPWRQLVCSMLQKQSDLQVVGEARDGLEAIQKAAELKPDFVLLDINLPTVNGLEAAKQIRKAAHNAKILFVSLINDPDLIAAAMNDGASGYILKIDVGTELLAAIRAAIKGDHFVSRAMKL